MRYIKSASYHVVVFLVRMTPQQLVSREPSPYQPPVETNNIPVTPNKPSPTRQCLPPMPETSSSPFATMAMPEPHPFQPPDMPVAKPY